MSTFLEIVDAKENEPDPVTILTWNGSPADDIHDLRRWQNRTLRPPEQPGIVGIIASLDDREPGNQNHAA